MFGLSKKWTDFIINRRRNQILAISSSPTRSKFFNSLLESRDLNSISARDLASTVMQALDLASKLPQESLESELNFYQFSKDSIPKVYPSQPSSLRRIDYVYGFDV